MTPEQAAAFVQSQTACAMAEIASMHAENREREIQDHTHAYGPEAFRAVPDEFGIGYNDVVGLFQGQTQLNLNLNRATAHHSKDRKIMQVMDKLKTSQDASAKAEKQMLDVLMQSDCCQFLTVSDVKQIAKTAGRLAFDATEQFRLEM